MAIKDNNTNDIDLDQEENEEIEVQEDINLEAEDPDLSLEEEENTVEDVTEIPIEEFMKDPEKMSKLSDDVDAQETTKWCPQCSDYTIFVDNVCTECGFTKNIKASKDKEEDEEESKGFQLSPDEDLEIVEELGYDIYEGEDNPDA